MLISSPRVPPKLPLWLPDAGRVGMDCVGHIDRGWSVGIVTGQVKKFWVLLHSRVTMDKNNILYVSKSLKILHQEVENI